MAMEVLHNTCNMYTHNSPDMYALSALGFGHTYQVNHVFTCYNCH